MKVGELREKLAKLPKAEIIKLASEFYKLIPKAKKEDYAVDNLINNPQQKKPKKTPKVIPLSELEPAIELFIENAKAQNYLVPNRAVPKKERATWRFKVKKWYKSLIDNKGTKEDLRKKSDLLLKLYELLCESCAYQYFTAYDTFQSVGVEQTTFFMSVIQSFYNTKGKQDSIAQCIKLIINNDLNRYTLYSSLMIELLKTYDLPDLNTKAIEVTKRLLAKNNFKPQPRKKSGVYIWGLSTDDYTIKRKNNNLAELGLRLHHKLFEVEKGVAFFEKHHYENREEISLYVLVSILLRLREKEQIVKAIKRAKASGIEPRDRLQNLLQKIEETDTLPEYM